MTMHSGRRRIAFGAVLLGVALLAGCKNVKPDGAPPRADDTIAVKPQSSLIAVPVEADLRQLSAALEQAVPRQLWTIDKPNQTCVASSKVKVLIVKIKTPVLHCRIIGEVTRGPLALSGTGRDLVVTLPIHATIRAQKIGGIIKQETATADARVRAVVRLDMAPDWSPRGKVDIAYDWTREPGIDFMGQRIEFTSKADAKLQGVIAKLERSLPQELSKLRVKDKVQRSWGEAFTSLQLNKANPPVWMRVTPQELQYGGYSVQGNKLVLRLGMMALTETFVGNRPADPPRGPLPPVRPMQQQAGSMLFFIPVIADYTELEPVVQKALIKRSARPFEVPGVGPVTAEFGKVTIYGVAGGRIAVGATFSVTDAAQRIGKASGTVWLTGLPVNPPNTQQVLFQNVEVAGVTDSTSTNLLLKVANAPAISETIGQALAQNFAKDYDKLMGKISRAIDEKREGDLLIRARITNIRTEPLKAAGQGLYLPVWGTGTASIVLSR